MSVSPSSFSKQPYEQFTIDVKFTKRLAVGETLQTSTVIAADPDGADVTATVISGQLISGNDIVRVGVKAGTTGNTYKLTVRATTNLTTPGTEDHRYEGDIDMIVLEQ